jgi:signal transduction histidine kinase
MSEQSSEEEANKPGIVTTHFAPAGRAEHAKMAEMSGFVTNHPLFQAVLESMDGFMMILNPQRQVLAVNRQLREILKDGDIDCRKGDRPGELLGCIHASEGPDGCGTAKNCATCGAAIAILASQSEHRPATGECLATVRRGDHDEALEFRVRATPVNVAGHDFTVLVFNDISGDKRRETLERVFFHDILNTVGGLMGWSSLLQRLDNLDPREAAGRILSLSRRLKEEIEDQRSLSQAELGTLDITMTGVSVQNVLDNLRSIFSAHDAAKGKTLEIAGVDAEERIVTDASLLLRVLTNMTKNALEAMGEGETARVWFERQDGAPVFCVHNPGAIPEDTALRMFQRSFSTKTRHGRGIGTYSMKLFGERYLGGKVDFVTSWESGTVFSIKLPIRARKKTTVQAGDNDGDIREKASSG